MPTPEQLNQMLAWFPLRWKKATDDMFPDRIVLVRGPTLGIMAMVTLDGQEMLVHHPTDNPYEAAAAMTYVWTETGPIQIKVPCTCGARTVGVPDFSPQHSSWCQHTPRRSP